MLVRCQQCDEFMSIEQTLDPDGCQQLFQDTFSDVNTLSQLDWEVLKTPIDPVIEDVEDTPHHRFIISIFETASHAGLKDFPYCDQCMTILEDSAIERLESMRKEKNMYQEFLNSFHDENDSDTIADAELQELEKEEEEVNQLLDQLKAEQKQADEQLIRLEKESAAINDLEEEIWSHVRVLEVDTEEGSRCLNAVQSRIDVNERLHHNLKRTNVYDDVFYIHYDGHFGTINGFKLGKLASQNVHWNEITSALGQCVLLTDTIAHALNYEFIHCELVPRGSFSKIIRLNDRSVFELYRQSRGLFNRNFDTAMGYFVGCVAELGDEAERREGKSVFKYEIRNDQIGGYSVKLQFNNDEKWTKALKYLLLNLKALIYWCARHDQ